MFECFGFEIFKGFFELHETFISDLERSVFNKIYS